MRLSLFTPLLLCACGGLADVGRAPEFSPLEGSYQHHAMYSNPLPADAGPALLIHADRMAPGVALSNSYGAS